MIAGISYMMPTPFLDDESIDLESISQLVGFCKKINVGSITILGVAGEAAKLSQSEKIDVIKMVISESTKQFPIIVGVSDENVENIQHLIEISKQNGISDLMLAPHKKWGSFKHIQKIIKNIAFDNSDLNFTFQDYPDATGVTLTTTEVAAIINGSENINSLKAENLPTPDVIAETITMVSKEVQILGGMGGLYFFYELLAGSVGAMTGFSFPEMLVEIYSKFIDGFIDEAREAYEKALPLLVFEGQPKIGLSIRKEILFRRGIIRSSRLRSPAPSLTESTLNNIVDLVERFSG